MVERFERSVDLIVLRIDRLSHPTFFPRGYLVVPEWVGTKLQVPDDINAFVRTSSNIQRDVRRVRTHKYRPVVGSAGQGLDRFYQSYYLPLSKARYGQLMIVRPIHDFRRRVRRGGILWVCREKEPVAALLFEQKGDAVDVLAVGTLDGDPVLMKEGAIAALYYFIIDLARTRSCRTVDFRGSRPSLSDGVLRYKCKWGATLYDKVDSFHDLLVHWPEVNGVVKDFLTHTPLIYRDEGGFSGLIGCYPENTHDFRINGLRRLYCLTESGFREIPN